MLQIDPNRILELTKLLCRIPSVSGHAQDENRCAEVLYGELSSIRNRTKARIDAELIACENDALERKAVWGLLRAPHETDRTVLLTGHFDVVPTDVCGAGKDLAFDLDAYSEFIARQRLNDDARADLESGDWLFGRGVMDMKCGLALFIAAIETLAGDPGLKINVAFLAVPDEENNSAGMRGALPAFSRLCETNKLDIVAALTGEPCFITSRDQSGKSNRPYYTGTTGKIMPVFYAVGSEAHVNDYFQGINAALAIAKIVEIYEASPARMEGQGASLLTPPACLSMQTRRVEYSVTLPSRACAYFNLLTIEKTTTAILSDMADVARRAQAAVREKLEAARKEYCERGGKAGPIPGMEVISVEELKRLASLGFESEEKMRDALQTFRKNQPAGLGEREYSIREIEWLWERSGRITPSIVVGFLPPYYPARINKSRNEKESRLKEIIREGAELGGRLIGDGGTSVIDVFGGITDLSYLGFEGDPEELNVLARNMPGWNHSFWLPIEILSKLDIPVANMGPSGKDAHKATERLELRYSLEVAPKLLLRTIERLQE